MDFNEISHTALS